MSRPPRVDYNLASSSRPPAGRPSRARRRAARRRLLPVLCLVALLVAAIAVKAALSTNTHGARTVSYDVHGPGGEPLAQLGVVPAHARRRPPLLVFLHGKGQDQSSNATSAFYAALAALGNEAPDVVFPYGGEDSYWHNRSSGGWATYVLRGVIPMAVRRLGADPRRVAIAGLSMGGFGAFDIARLDPGRFCALGADSAALWSAGGETAAGAFDNEEDFERHNLLAAAAGPDPYRGKHLWLDVGTEDPFRAADTRFADALKAKGAAIQFHVWQGGHDAGYWNSHWGPVLTFYARQLARCT
jgi:S-formylglutathione hydrolase FrmB